MTVQPTPSLATQCTTATDATFVGMVMMSMVAAAVAISGEGNTTPNHANRVTLAKAVLNNPPLYAPMFTYAAASQAVDKTSADIDINNVVSAVWNGIAGVS